MTIENGRFNPEDRDEIIEQLISGAEDAFGQELDADDTAVIRSFYEPVADYLASQQEDISATLDSAQIDYAEGRALDLLAALIGVSRREATESSTRLKFSRASPTPRSYTIPSDTEVQTDESEPVVFSTDTPVVLRYLDGFEDNNLDEYSGDTGSFSVQTGTVNAGSYALQSASSMGDIYNTSIDIGKGSVFNVKQYVESNSIAGTTFGVVNGNNYYDAILDTSAGEIRLEVTESGSNSTIGTESATIPSSEWVDVRIEWKHGDEFEISVTDSSGTDIATLETTDSSPTIESGGVGFSSHDGSTTKYWDEFRMSAVSVDASSLETGQEQNVGPNTLTQLRADVAGIDSVTNPITASDGRAKETDENFRERAKDSLSSGMRATLPALIFSLRNLDVTKSVSVLANDSVTTDSAGRPPHSFEAVVEVSGTDHYDLIAETIMNNKAAGDVPVGGYSGQKVSRTVELSNGQQKPVSFSTPTDIKVYMDIDLLVSDEYAGHEAALDRVVQYIGGTLSSGSNISGDLGSSDDVIYNRVIDELMDTAGVHDVTTLEIGTSSNPSGTSNLTIGQTDTATANANDGSLDISSTDL
jgi:uncharacterized phage protein gp47/JayE